MSKKDKPVGGDTNKNVPWNGKTSLLELSLPHPRIKKRQS
jgi:hypothetical protein